MVKVLCILTALLSLAVAIPVPRAEAGSGAGTNTIICEVRIPIEGGRITAYYVERAGTSGFRQHLQITVYGGEPESVYKVRVNGVRIGTVTTNSNGSGSMVFRNPPLSIPRIRQDSVLTVGSYVALFQQKA